MAAVTSYERPELLADPDWLWERRDDPNVRVVDCATSDAYDRAHIPGAFRIPGHPWLKTEPDPYSHMNEPLHVIGPDDFASAMGEIGVSNDITVVAYDSLSHQFATRLWWVLAYYGHRNAKVLDGGFHRWLAEGRPISDAVPEVDAGSFVPRPHEAQIVRLDELRARYGEPGVQVVNALGPGFYSGRSNPFDNQRVGHIPGSINLPFSELLTSDEPRVLKSAVDIARLALSAGLRPDLETIVHCQAGIATTLDVFALTLMGWDRVRCYDAAMGEWANRDDTPLVVGEGIPAQTT
jgi:thiosulfate/3-mercaptopyruvate sulfurtransferase